MFHRFPARESLWIATALVVSTTTFAGESSTPQVERRLVVSGQGYFPVAIRLHDGRLAVVLRGGAPHLGIQGRLDVVFSSDEGQNWSRPIVVNDSPVDDRNPAFGQAADGSLVVGFYRTARYDDQGRYNEGLRDRPVGTWVTRSTDGGKSWSQPTEIDVSDVGWGSPYGKIVTMPDGTLLMPIYGGGPRAPGGTAAVPGENSYLYRSTDHGRTWVRHGCVGHDRFNETGVVRLESGALLAAMRTADDGSVWTTRSSDGGKTWSEPARLTPGAVHPADLSLLSDGRVLLVTGYRVGPYGVRAMVGDKDGRFDWKQHVILMNDATSGDCGYPSAVVLKDGRALVSYYAVGSREHPEWHIHCGAAVFRP